MMKSMKRCVAASLIAAMMICLVPAVTDSMYAEAASKPAKVKVTSAKILHQKITLKWKKAKGAKKYQVFVKIKSGAWKKKATVKAKNYVLRKCKWNTKYALKVRGVNGSKKGSFSLICQGKTPKKTTIEKALKKNPAILKEMKKQVKGMGTDEFATSVDVKQNTFVLDLKLKEQVPDEDVDYLKEVLDKQFSSKSVKTKVKQGKKKIEDKAGIYGLKYKINVLNADGTLITSQSY